MSEMKPANFDGMTPTDGALAMAALGLNVFPLRTDTKAGQVVKSWKRAATNDPQRIRSWGSAGHNFGVWAKGHVILDVDTAHGKPGLECLKALEQRLGGLPRTRRHQSPRGGLHLVFKLPPGVEVTNHSKPLGEGIDVRGAGGYVVAPGSTFEGKPYSVIDAAPIAMAPEQLVELLTSDLAQPAVHSPEGLELDTPAALAHAERWLLAQPVPIEGARGSTTYKAACQLFDFGVSKEAALLLIDTFFVSRFEPPYPPGRDTTSAEVEHAYEYAQNKVAGSKSVEAAGFEVFDAADIPAGPLSSPMLRGAPLRWPDQNPESGKIDGRSVRNIHAFLHHVGASVSLDEFAKKYLINGFEGFDGQLTDEALRALRVKANELGLRTPSEFFADVVLEEARRNKFHPVRDYLSKLLWDGTSRLNAWLSRAVGAPQTRLNAAMGELLLVAAVRRVLQPGCKWDYVPVLEGKQGVGKSELIRALGGEWAGASLSLHADEKTVIEQTSGQWIIEVPELVGLHSTRGMEHVKALVTRTTDKARAAYDRFASEHPRQWVLIASSNDREYLTDPTGNRRFFPIECGERFDLDWVREARDQLFAEAVAREKGYGWLELPTEHRDDLKALQGSREISSPYQVLLEPLLEKLSGFIPSTVIWRLVGFEARQPTQREAREIAAVMRKLGWESHSQKVLGRTTKGYKLWPANAGTPPVRDPLNPHDAVSVGELL